MRLREFLEWLSNEPDFNISKYDIDEILEDWDIYQNRDALAELDEAISKLVGRCSGCGSANLDQPKGWYTPYCRDCSTIQE